MLPTSPNSISNSSIVRSEHSGSDTISRLPVSHHMYWSASYICMVSSQCLK
nr:MAG TPA: hypothetical protein [Bacteriophage sp.]DAT70374.1 MAG TPA: hypothetical protein [Bacteriophage sp.]